MQPKIYHIDEHDIDSSLVDEDAITVIKRLREAGYTAYLVGGSVRDLLIKKKPKDFDISTSARPEEIKQIFQRSCLLIGRRFRLAHIRFGHKIIEVATFRSGENDSDLIVHDNCWGTPEEDVVRRDFTINGLYYDPETHTVIDYADGWKDIHKHILRTIGDPITRFKQDPVRMIRLLKFRARFNFAVDIETERALKKCREEIIKSSSARILEEILRMLESGSSEPFFRLMRSSGLLELLFPCLTYFLEGKYGEDVYKYLSVADTLNNNKDKRLLDRAILASCLLYPILEREIEIKYLEEGVSPNFGQIVTLAHSVIHGVVSTSFSPFPKKLTGEVHFILITQYRFTPLGTKRHHRPNLLHHKEFDMAFKFLKVRSLADERLLEDYNWWRHMYNNGYLHNASNSN